MMLGYRFQSKRTSRAIERSTRQTTRRIVPLLALMSCCFGVASIQAAERALRVLKVFEKANADGRFAIGQQTPGPAINRKGDVAYGANGVIDDGVWLFPPGGPPVCIARSDQLPGLSEVPQSAQWQAVSLNDAGMLAFGAYVHSRSQQSNGVWSRRPTFGIELVALSGQPAIGLEKQNFDRFSDIVACQGGEIGFRSILRPVGEVDPFHRDHRNVSGVWISQDGELRTIGPANEGHRSDSALMNERGSVVCSIDFPRHSEARIYRSGTERVALPRFQRTKNSGQEGVTIVGSRAFGFNNAEQISFLAAIRTTNGQSQTPASAFGILDAGATTPSLLFTDGMKVDGERVGELNPNQVTLLNARGDFAAFERHYISSKYFNAVCFAKRGGPLRTIARSNGLAPGADAIFSMPASVHEAGGQHVFGQGAYRYPGSSSVFSRLVLNARGQLAFTAQLGGDVSKEDNVGLWATRPDGHDLQLIARTGDTIHVGDDDVRTIKHILFAGPSGNEDARPSGMNDDGQIAFAVAFVDGSLGVVVSHAVAGDAGDAAAVPDELAEKPAIEPATVAAALDKWEKAAAIRLEEAKREFHDSDNERLTRLAKSLREEYKKLFAEAAAWQVEQVRANDATDQDREQHAKWLRLQHLTQIWRGLAEWPYREHQEASSASKREFDIATNLLLGKYGRVDLVTDRVARVQEQLQQYAPATLVREGGVERFLRPGERLFRTNRQGKKLRQFAESIGPELPESLQSPPDVFPTEGAVDGPLVQFRAHIRALLKLTMRSDGRLELDQTHWTKPTAKLSSAQLASTVRQLLSDSGVDDDRIGRLRGIFSSGVGSDPQSSAFVGHFDSLRTAAVAAGGSGGGGSGGSNDEFRLRLRSVPLTAYATGTANSLVLELTENTSPKRELTVATEGDHQLEVELDSRDHLMRFTQKEDGTVRLLAGPIEDLKKLSADNFAALLKSHEQEVRKTFLQPLQVFGVLTP